MWKIKLFELTFDHEEEEAAQRVIKNQWLTLGEENLKFEKEFAAYHGSKFCLTLSSCTAALHLALLAAGIGPGDEVIVPALTFIATVNAVKYTRGVPVLGDVCSPARPLLDPGKIVSLITKKTKAIIPVHFGGYPCDMESILKLGKKYNLKIIEDCAHSPGAKYKDSFCGTIGDIGCFSFFSNKNLSMGEGGAILTESEEIYNKIKLLRSHGMSSLSFERDKGRIFSYDVIEEGYNYRLHEINAAIGLAQLKKLPKMNQKRNRLTNIYREELRSSLCQIPFLDYTEATGVDHIMPVFLPPEINRPDVIDLMKNEGIQTSVHYPPIHRFSSCKKIKRGDLSITEDLTARELTLPLYPGMNETDVKFVTRGLKMAIKKSYKTLQ